MPAGRTYTPISKNTLLTDSASVTLSNISGDYTDLIIVINGLANTSTAFDVRFNNDTGTNYSATRLTSDGTSLTSIRSSNGSSMPLGYITTSESMTIINIINYSNTATYKTVIARGNAADIIANAIAGLWRSTSAISSMNFTGGTFFAGTTFNIYGIKAA